MKLYKWISLKKERIQLKLTLSNNSLRVVTEKYFWSNNSLRVVTEKYFCLTLLYCWHSRIIWTTVNKQLQEGHCGGSSWRRRYWCVRRVWPMQSVLRITASRRLRWVKLQQPRESLTKCNLLDVDPSQSACQSPWQWTARLWYKSVAGHFTAFDSEELRAMIDICFNHYLLFYMLLYSTNVWMCHNYSGIVVMFTV